MSDRYAEIILEAAVGCGVTMTPEQAMQNADRWWDVASKLPCYNAEPLEPPNVS